MTQSRPEGSADAPGSLDPDSFLQARQDCLRAAFDTVIPSDEWVGAWDGGVRTLLAEHAADFMSWALAPLDQLCIALDAVAGRTAGTVFAGLSEPQRREVFESVLVSGAAQAGVEAIISVADQGYYGGTSAPAGWAMLGFDPDAVVAEEPASPSAIGLAGLADEYDVVVIGAGAGGGVAAAELAATGRHVLLLDRSRPMSTTELRSNHLQGKRMQLFDVTAGAGAGSPRVLELPDGSSRMLPGDGDGGEYGLVAMTLGGGTRLWQGLAWRFYDEDFHMATTYGVPAESTLADWPFGYDDLSPFYDRVEWELGVSGDGTSAMANRTPRNQPFPMPALPTDRFGSTLAAGASRLGWTSSPIPFAINSVPRDGRPACVGCGQCVGHACPVNAKNGTHNTFIPRAVATGNCDLLLSAQAIEITHDGAGTAHGVRVVIDLATGPVERFVRARQVVVAAGAVESPRLLLASGLGNEWVGRNHHTHGIAGATALTGLSKTYTGPGHSIANTDWLHRNGEAWGGGVLIDAPPMYPVALAQFGRRLPGLAWGAEHKRWMRETGPLGGTMSMVQEIPDSSARITLDPAIVDRWGMPVPRLAGVSNAATREAVDYMAERCVEWLEAAGGSDIIPMRFWGAPQGAEHSAGTARLAADPAHGACDPQGKLFGTRNVYVADASLHPTNGGFNPGLTVMANAMRVASLMAT